MSVLESWLLSVFRIVASMRESYSWVLLHPPRPVRHVSAYVVASLWCQSLCLPPLHALPPSCGPDQWGVLLPSSCHSVHHIPSRGARWRGPQPRLPRVRASAGPVSCCHLLPSDEAQQQRMIAAVVVVVVFFFHFARSVVVMSPCPFFSWRRCIVDPPET